MYDFETTLTPLKKLILTHIQFLQLWRRHGLSSVVIHNIHDTLSKVLVHIADENPQHLIKRFVKALTEKQETIAASFGWHPYLSGFQILPGETEQQ